VVERDVAGGREVVGPRRHDHVRAVRARDRDRVVLRARVDDDDLVDRRGGAREAAAEAGGPRRARSRTG
jgi:hypothetical protein